MGVVRDFSILPTFYSANGIYLSNLPRDLRVTLVCNTLLPVDEPATVGIQDKDRHIIEGIPTRDGAFEFSCAVEVRSKGADAIDFHGRCVHGTSAARFLYLSWKRTIESATPWVQRVKIPLVFFPADLETVTAIRADITGRRPHASEPIEWTMTHHQ